ncbi:MAG: hypothetical protein ACO20W_10410, partial [Anaerohalosphaeraceae bacterium]
FAVNPDGFLDKHRCGICCSGDERRMAEQLGEMLGENRYQQLGYNGLRYVKGQHDISKIIEQYKNIFVDGVR